MIIAIVVGIDRTGKTPLIQLMQDVDPTIVTKRLVNAPRDPRALTKAGAEISTWPFGGPGHVVVYDRFPYPDDFVYGGLLKRPDFVYWEKRIADSGAAVKVVYVEPISLTAFRRHAATDPDKYFDMTDMNVILDHLGRYKVWLAQTTLPVMRMSCDRNFVIGDGRRVVEWLKRPM